MLSSPWWGGGGWGGRCYNPESQVVQEFYDKNSVSVGKKQTQRASNVGQRREGLAPSPLTAGPRSISHLASSELRKAPSSLLRPPTRAGSERILSSNPGLRPLLDSGWEALTVCIPGEGHVRRVSACTLRFFSSSVTIDISVGHIQGSLWATQEKPGEKRELFWFEKRSKNHRIRGAHIERDLGTHLCRCHAKSLQ